MDLWRYGTMALLFGVASAVAAQSGGPTLEMVETGATATTASARIAAAARTIQAGRLGIGRPLGPLGQKSVAGRFITSRLYAFPGDPGGGHAFLTGASGTAVCHVRIPKGTTPSRLATFIDGCVGRLGDTAGMAASPVGRTARNAAREDIPNSHPENWRAVSGVYFYRGVSFGYGGAMIITFRPVVLFTDSSYYEIDDAPLEDIDLPAERAAHPKRFGRWTRRGATFTLFDEKGRGHDYAMGTGNFFKAFPATERSGLSGSYSSVSGGGNNAIGGTTGYLADSRMNFTPDGAFTTGQSVAFSDTGAQSGVATTMRSRNPVRTAGRYSTDHYTLTVTQSDGRQLRRFFCFASDGSTGAIQTSMIFVGDNGYTQKR
ncbi:hypothetical protein HL653_21120 [Sphingomonas sp. AP4-R1]|uniref:hypothetical protein n=1 Tax=Sphingomonas sp. AP4-R1 TaxID=2735134 RepID=UPI001493969B|nr:hypothetical protein [Sphingomonas sp. AP4-R1]QJU59912.1 hypothetical protein HL653_21120 [Sphingomonas sp. AP4-R1]